MSFKPLIVIAPLIVLAGCGASGKPATTRANAASAASETKPDDTAQEVKEAEEHLYPSEPLLGKAWVATRLHMIVEWAKDYPSARPGGTACGTLHVLPEEAIHAECETKWGYEGESFTTRSWVTVSPHANVNVEAVAQGPTTSPTGRQPIASPSKASESAPSTPPATTSTPEPSPTATGSCGSLPETSTADGVGSINAAGADCATARAVTAVSLERCSRSSTSTCSDQGWSCKVKVLTEDEGKEQGICTQGGDRITWVTVGAR